MTAIEGTNIGDFTDIIDVTLYDDSSTTIKYTYTISHYLYPEFELNLAQISLIKLRKQMFVPRKIDIKKVYKSKYKPINIRNKLPIKIRID